MGRYISLLFLVFIGFHSDAEDHLYESIPEYRVDSVKANEELNNGKAQVIVHISNLYFSEGETILYGFDGEGLETQLNDKKAFSFKLDSGEHYLQFYAPEKVGLVEITTPSIRFESKTTTHISLNFKMEIELSAPLKKPVIYLYPEEKTGVSVEVKAKGELSFTYPTYNGRWNCTAYPSGELLINENSYNYLFWEAEYAIEIDKLNETEGIVVLKEDLIQFLEGTLDSYGFTSQEKMDFITFWGPQMIEHEATEIRFMLNEECELFADLEITPIPDNLLRFYMIWNPMDAFYHKPESTLTIATENRTGFTVLEWGGMEIPRGDRLENRTKATSIEN